MELGVLAKTSYSTGSWGNSTTQPRPILAHSPTERSIGGGTESILQLLSSLGHGWDLIVKGTN